MRIPDFSVPRQTARMSLEDALLFVTKQIREVAGPNASQLSILALTKLLERSGVDVPAKGEETEAALLYALVMTLVYFDKCNSLILTSSSPAADAFFSRRLFSPKGPTGRDFTFRFGKRLLARLAIDEAADLGRILNNSNDILVLDFAAMPQLLQLAGLGPSGAEPKVAWWKKPVFSSAAGTFNMRSPHSVGKGFNADA